MRSKQVFQLRRGVSYREYFKVRGEAYQKNRFVVTVEDVKEFCVEPLAPRYRVNLAS